MSLSYAVGRHFPLAVRQRGEAYYRGHSVIVASAGDYAVEATVHGTFSYLVTIDREGSILVATCQCPFYDDHGAMCKHIWATLLHAEAKGHLGGANGGPPLAIRAPEDWLNDDLERPPPAPRPAMIPSAWRQSLAEVDRGMRQPALGQWPKSREILYVADARQSVLRDALVIEVWCRDRKSNGEWTKLKEPRLAKDRLELLPDERDRELLTILQSAPSPNQHGYFPRYGRNIDTSYKIPRTLHDVLLPRLGATERFRFRTAEGPDGPQPITWDDGEPWQIQIDVAREANDAYSVAGALRRGQEQMHPNRARLLIPGLVFTSERAARLLDAGLLPWVADLDQERFNVPLAEGQELVEALVSLPQVAPLNLPEELSYREEEHPPRPVVTVRAPDARQPGTRMRAALRFQYAGKILDQLDNASRVWSDADRVVYLRDGDFEAAAASRLLELGFRRLTYEDREGFRYELAPALLPRAVKALTGEGFRVEADGKLFRQSGKVKVEVRSGIDWLELHGTVSFDEQVIDLPTILQAVRKGNTMVTLSDGSVGVLPEEWLRKYGLIAGTGDASGDHVRYRKNQAGLLDALLAAHPEASCDEMFARLRSQLSGFGGIEPAKPHASFQGTLRPYQQDGLGWLFFLQRFGFGGCLADDMGLGKTVQVLAMLQAHRHARKAAGEQLGPALVVAPRSLVFHWQNEAHRFAPDLRVLDHTGSGRGHTAADLVAYDLVLTTYGTLRNDILTLRNIRFDYCILDESQAIKNSSSATSKAARLLQAEHRLALSGTPIENHLGELWSLFEFLNPGILGSATVFAAATSTMRDPGDETLALLRTAVRPFLLRRTKSEVLTELPEKLEETSFCDLKPEQRKLYDELRTHYRGALLGRIDKQGINRSKIQVLEALLRLRQAACHPGLLDPARSGERSAKLDQLLLQLEEVLAEGHKVLVFSQFTSFLAILRDRLDRIGTSYEYLDGRTRNRADKVARFQEDPACRLFLISLKAGGLGLNLTAADYVFLLDPWWNPAVEAQAVDRAHRIGQTRRVFAYRLIARDTIEEKVLELQEHKRGLADSIITADNSLIRNLKREDLELLLS